ncbi:hypothetical protein HYPSUDRAFT_60680 [Hypholoma sublateritium FD-334 SS-4]|uniref:non-specific serine/threonine protein kinase n=1 Tax=Hypholoma sublateritium (strain FD-334 SS-4) TaxID=945553 RepID=A0A0D2PGA3_HYPSF|nr:hypothetical protein HYPSUDRAFT_60680 [Hypholoma sublateritium FD-334 SS-4]
MLGSRTKQINAYGRRGKRVIDDRGETNQTLSGVEIISIFDDLPPPQWKAVASRMKKRENSAPHKPSMLSTKVVGLQRRKRLSPVLSPPKKKQTTRVGQLIESEAIRKPKAVASKSMSKSEPAGNAADPIICSASPLRAPLSSVALNIPGSPIGRNAYRSADKAPVKTKKPFSPFVDVDIIVFDDEGHTIQTERRVSRTNVDVNPFHHPSGPRKNRDVSPDTSDSDCEIVSLLPRRGQRKTAHKAVILSESSDSEADTALPEPILAPVPSNSKGTQSTYRSRVEVLVPRLPYKLSNRHSAPSTSEIAIETPSHSPVTETYNFIPAIPRFNMGISTTKARHQRNDSPLQKIRQLTPIRGDRRRLFEPPSPAALTDLDSSINLSDLSFESESPSHKTYQCDFDIPDSLIPLLEECHQETSGPHNFSTFIESFRYDPILQSARQNKAIDMEFRKIGEASYSEVFGIGDVVLKVIPLRDESNTDDGPAPSDAKDVRKEIIVTRAMGDVHDGFVKLLKTYVVRGRYPEVLLNLWDEYNERKGSESMRPDGFKVSQVYAIIVLPNGGPDLEAYTFCNANRTGWRQACSLFWQVAKALTHAEHLVSFEHRDLHWGQVLVKNVPTNALKSLNLNQKAMLKSDRVYMDDLAHGVQATVIDLGLSRMDAGDGSDGLEVHWTPFDDEVFMGEGDYQFDVYRMMKYLTKGLWEEFHPTTNILWLHYLLQKIIYSKGIKPPATPRKPKGTSQPPLPKPTEAAFSEKDCYDCLIDIESWLANAITEMGKARRKTQVNSKAAFSGPNRAGEVVAYGVKKGWIKSNALT